jgi:putative DNA primase/helicase
VITWQDFPIGEHRTPCPACGHGKRDKTLGISVEVEGCGVAHCFRCGHIETFRPQTSTVRWKQRAEKPQIIKHRRLSNYGQQLWAECQPLSGTVGESYLLARRCVISPEDGHLRYHPGLHHKPSNYTGPALVALVTDAFNGEPMTLHRTWIQSDGHKVDITPPRLLLGGHQKQGGVIRLWGDERVTHGLGVAEGIETALSLAHAFEPVWSVIDAGNLATLPVLSGVECLLIAADNDLAGIKAANECALRWSNEGVEVRITQQTENDLNDALLEAA